MPSLGASTIRPPVHMAKRVARVCLKCQRNPLYCPENGCEEYRAACQAEMQEIKRKAKEGQHG